MDKLLLVLQQVGTLLGQANVAAPIIIGTISTIVQEIRAHAAANGAPDPFEGKPTSELVDLLETDLRANVNFGDEEIARLKAKLAAAEPPPAAE